MTKPKFKVDILPSQAGKVYYLPLAPKSLDHEERLKIAVQLKIEHADNSHATLTITNITFSFPGTALATRTMAREQEYMKPKGGVLGFGQVATWCNGSVRQADGEKAYNQIYLDPPAPPRLQVDIYCAECTEPWSFTYDLIAWRPDATGALLLPFARYDLADDEYVVTSARHWFNGEEKGTQIYAYDIGIQARVDDEWTTTYSGSATHVQDIRIFGRPVRAMADGEVVQVKDGGPDNPYGDEIENPTANYVWVRYGALDVKYSHLREGSIVVAVGPVSAGQKLAEAGNSGNTSGTPHLHMECRTYPGETLRGFSFKNCWQLARELVPADNGPGRRVRIKSQGICEEKAALRPFAAVSPPPGPGTTIEELETLVGEVLGGVAKGGGGWIFVNGKLIKVPPRGIKWALLKGLAELDAAEGLGRAASASRVKQIVDGLGKALKAAKGRGGA